ncbi:hypothetical protein V1514DRAFT_338286 [Lipomyces japonicus]|uniref:uncharacterized protein n=1 Tax=Lipomyces japonicus TaxID=56871 RepID=UPI0034CD9974
MASSTDDGSSTAYHSHSPLQEDDGTAHSLHERSSDRHKPGTYRAISPEPDEQTRLLISAEDPAVDPYNLFVVRSLRRITVLFLLFSGFVSTLLLISLFFSIPSMTTRGSNFAVFLFFLISGANFGISLTAFNLPSKSSRIVSIIMVGFLTLNLILSLSVTRLRNNIVSAFGILALLWVIFSAFWVFVSSILVDRAARGQEERIIGRRADEIQARRSWKQWCSVMWTLILFIILLVLVFFTTLSIIVDAYDSRVAPSGDLVTVQDGAYRVHLYCSRPADDSEDPTILLEPGVTSAEVFAQEWTAYSIDDEKSSIYGMRYCYWDRPGKAFSDNGQSPLSAGMSIDALSNALSVQGELGPWILVSHGEGAIYSRIFAARHSSQVDGLVIIDGFQENYFVQRIGSSGRGFGYFLHGLISPLGIDKQIMWIFRGRTSVDRIYGGAQSEIDKYNLAKFQEQVAARSFTKNEIIAAREILPRNIPVAVLTSQDMIRNVEGWSEYQRDLTQLTDVNTEWQIIDAPHEVWRSDEGRKQIDEAIANIAYRTRRHGS